VAPPPLTWTDRKAQLLSELGIDAMVAYRTDKMLLSLTPEQFFGRVVRERLQARAVVEGPNFYFGRHRRAPWRCCEPFAAARACVWKSSTR